MSEVTVTWHDCFDWLSGIDEILTGWKTAFRSKAPPEETLDSIYSTGIDLHDGAQILQEALPWMPDSDRPWLAEYIGRLKRHSAELTNKIFNERQANKHHPATLLRIVCQMAETTSAALLLPTREAVEKLHKAEALAGAAKPSGATAGVRWITGMEVEDMSGINRGTIARAKNIRRVPGVAGAYDVDSVVQYVKEWRAKQAEKLAEEDDVEEAPQAKKPRRGGKTFWICRECGYGAGEDKAGFYAPDVCPNRKCGAHDSFVVVQP